MSNLPGPDKSIKGFGYLHGTAVKYDEQKIGNIIHPTSGWVFGLYVKPEESGAWKNFHLSLESHWSYRGKKANYRLSYCVDENRFANGSDYKAIKKNEYLLFCRAKDMIGLYLGVQVQE